MKKKITFICSFVFCVVVLTSAVFASTYTDIMADLNSIYSDAAALNAQYETLLADNAAKIAAIGHATEAQNLADHILQNNAQTLYNTIINEVVAMYGASDPLAVGLQTIKSQAKPIADQVKSTQTEIEDNFEKMSATELEAVINKVRDITTDFGGSETITADYNTIIASIDALKVKLNNLNTRVESFAATYDASLRQIFTKSIAKSIANKVSDGKYTEALELVKQELILAGATTAPSDIDAIKSDIENIKVDAKDLADKVKVSYVYLTIPQITNIKTKAEQIANMYVTFAKHMEKTYSTPYVNKLRTELYALELNASLDKADELIDYAVSYKAKIATKKNSAKKYLAVFAALGYDEDDIKDYIKNNYQTEYDKVIDKIDAEFDSFVDHIGDLVDDEIADIKADPKVYTARQVDLKLLNEDLLAAMTKIANLKSKANTELAKIDFDFTDVQDLVNTYETTAYNKIYEKIFDVIDEILKLETTRFKYDAANKYLIYTQMPTLSEFKSLLGVTESKYQYTGLVSSEITTMSKVRINLSSIYFEIYGIVNVGDVNSDRVYDISDVVTVIDKALNKVTLTGERLVAADLNQNSVYDITDIVIMIDKSLERI